MKEGAEPQGADRRRGRRVPIRIHATLEARDPKDAIHITVLNFSEGGFYCRVSRALPVMTKLGIHFVFPPFGDRAQREMEAVALVVRCERPKSPEEESHLAAAFVEIEADSRQHIRDYVTWYETVNGLEEEEEEANTSESSS